MRALTKLAEPVILTEKATEWTAEYVAGAAIGKPPRGRWGHPEIRDRLKDEVLCKCAYCEAYVEDVSYSEVEHIIPKSVKPELAYAWGNLTSACKRCNTAKGSYYDPVDSLLDPYVDDIDEHLQFLGDFIDSKLGSRRGEISLDTLKLNRQDLYERRRQRLISVKHMLERWHAASGQQKAVLARGIRIDAVQGEFSRSVTAYLEMFGFQP